MMLANRVPVSIEQSSRERPCSRLVRSSCSSFVHSRPVSSATSQESCPARCLHRTPLLSRNVITRTATEEAPAATVSEGGWWTKEGAANMHDISNIQQLVDALADAGDKLVIVEFFAPWCNACKALYPKICRMMAEHVEDVVFLKVNFEANRDMCKTLGIKVLPMFHFYRGAEGKVDQFTVTISKIQRLKDALELYTAAFCSLEAPPGVAEFPEVLPHAHEVLPPDADQPTNLAKVGAWDRPS
ncbi:thioredoxin-like protein [Haematococcus lacustris]